MQLLNLTDLPDYITSSSVVLYPTDTIYGLGGLVTPEVVEKILRIKQRPAEKALSIIAPNFDRIIKHFVVEETFPEERNQRKHQFPWRWLTLLLPLRDDVTHEIDFSLLSSTTRIGIRLLDHPFQTIVTKLGKPCITTSANLSWQANITHPNQLLETQTQLIDYYIDEWTLDRPASVIIDRTTQEVIRA